MSASAAAKSLRRKTRSPAPQSARCATTANPTPAPPPPQTPFPGVAYGAHGKGVCGGGGAGVGLAVVAQRADCGAGDLVLRRKDFAAAEADIYLSEMGRGFVAAVAMDFPGGGGIDAGGFVGDARSVRKSAVSCGADLLRSAGSGAGVLQCL